MAYVFCNRKKGKWVPAMACEVNCCFLKKCPDFKVAMGADKTNQEGGCDKCAETTIIQKKAM